MDRPTHFAAARVPRDKRHDVTKVLKKRFPSASLQDNPNPLFLNVMLPNKEADNIAFLRTALRVEGLLDR